MALVKINGRDTFVDCETFEIKKVGSGRYECDYGRAKFDIIGGRESGGASNEWFVRNVEFYGDQWLPVNSMRAAIRLGVQW